MMEGVGVRSNICKVDRDSERIVLSNAPVDHLAGTSVMHNV
jgi:hypothetical protein